MDELLFESVPVPEWSIKNTEDWLKSCLIRYQLDDPKMHTKIKMKGKTLMIYHDYRELNKFYAEKIAEKLHEDLDIRLGRKLVIPCTHKPSKISTRKPTWALLDKFGKQLEDINVDFGKLLNGNDPGKQHANELIIEALYALKGSGNIMPIECIISRMANSFFKQYTMPNVCDSPLKHLERGHIKLQLPIDDVVGAFVQKFYLHGYPALAELILEHILYLGQLDVIKTNYKSDVYPVIVIPTSSTPKCEFTYLEVPSPEKTSKRSDDSGYASANPSPRTSWTDVETKKRSIIVPTKLSLDTAEKNIESIDDSLPSYSPVWDDQNERSQNSVFIEENNFVVDYSTDNHEKLTFDYDANLSIKFDVIAQESQPKTITNLNNQFKVTIENDSKEDIGFSLRAYNLSIPGDIKALHPLVPGLGFQILKAKRIGEPESEEKCENIWKHDIELQTKLVESSGDYILFELVVCSLKNISEKVLKGNTWNIQRNYIQVKCESEKNPPTDLKTRDELYALVNKSMGTEKRKKCLKILLESLHYFAMKNEEKAYWLATQLILLPDFQRPQLLILCWLIIGTYIYQDVPLDFSGQRKLIALINAGTEIKKKIETLKIEILKNVVKFSDGSLVILRHYLDRQKIKKSQSCPENIKNEAKKSIPSISIIRSLTPVFEDSPITSPDELRVDRHSKMFAKSEPSLIIKDITHESTKINTVLLKDTKQRHASQIENTLVFGKCEITCPPSRTEIEIKFGYTIKDTPSSQSTIVPGVSHFATLELTNDFDTLSYISPYQVKFPIPTNISKEMSMRVVYQDGNKSEDITENIRSNFDHKTNIGSIMAQRNGIYIILGVEGFPGKVTSYVANEILIIRSLYVQMWSKKVKGSSNWSEIWFCISCKEEQLIRPPHSEAWPLGKVNLNTKFNDKIEFSLLLNKKENYPSNEPEMKHEFNLTDTQGVFNFVHIIDLEIVEKEGRFRIKTQEDELEKVIQFGKFL